MTRVDADFLVRVLRVFADADDYDAVFWMHGSETYPIRFLVNCNDVFWWGCADAEPITPANLDALEQAYTDAKAVGVEGGGAILFCARMRQMRPQGAAYPEERALWPLLDVCGPKRETGLGNPSPHPADAVDA